MIKINLSSSPFRYFVRRQYRNIVLKQALKLFRDSRFWTIPNDPICREILLDGYYEKDVLAGMCKLTGNKSGTCLDIGANIGNHSVYFSKHFAKVVAFEAHPRNAGILRANVHYNRLKNVTVVDKALSDVPAVLNLDDNPDSTNSGIVEGDSGCRVEAVKGDDALKEFNLPPVVMIKVDVEGWEPQVLRGLSETIQRDRPAVFWEAFTPETVAAGRAVLADMGYTHFYHLSRPDSKFKRAFSDAVYLQDLAECSRFDGLNVGFFTPPANP